MCGIFGFSWDDKELLKQMGDMILHRGPDDSAYYSDSRISLGMRRLAIIDLKKGLYPIKNEAGNLLVIFNGEIYNYKELREELKAKGHVFITECDAEIIPHAFEEWKEGFISRLNGMYAIAMFDTDTKRLYLFRDKLGEKPIYYTLGEDGLAFASEIKCFLPFPGFKKEIDERALDGYFTYRYIPGDRTILKSVKKLLPGHMLMFDGDIHISSFWDLSLHDNHLSMDENAARVRELLDDSVKIRLMSDVPLGAYLSGGLDSSAIVALMSKYTDRINTFNVSFSGTGFDESKYAQVVADHFNTNHTQIDIDVDAVSVLPKVAWHLDEPIADAATIPTFLMSKETRKKVTVILSGEGSDEIFGGYERFRHLGFAYNLRHIPKAIRSMPSMLKLKDKTYFRAAKLFSNLENKEKAYLSYYSVFDKEEKKRLYTKELEEEDALSGYFKDDFYKAIQKIDIKERLPANMLLKGDKMTMAHSIEGRMPFLDPRLVEFAASIPFSQKTTLFKDKMVYRKAIKGLVPDSIWKRKKHGFTVPLERWAKDGLKDYLFELVEKNREPYLDRSHLQKIVDNLKSPYYKRQFWATLMYEQWYDVFMGSDRSYS